MSCKQGQNGAGKSTLVKVLAGVHPPTHGEAFIFGLDIRHNQQELQKITGVCPQVSFVVIDVVLPSAPDTQPNLDLRTTCCGPSSPPASTCSCMQISKA